MKKTRPHILVANVFFAPHSYGGATHVAESLAQHLARDMRVTLVSAGSIPGAAPYSILRLSVLDGLDHYLINLPTGRNATQIYDNPAVANALKPLVAGLAPDLVHLHCLQELGGNLVNLCNSLHIPVILSMHDFWWVCARQFMLRADGQFCGQTAIDPAVCAHSCDRAAPHRARALAQMANQADIVTAPGPYARDLLMASGIDRVQVLTNGIHAPDPDFAARHARRLRANAPLRLGYLGGPSPIKGWGVLCAALRMIDPQAVELICVDAGMETPWFNATNRADIAVPHQIAPRFAATMADDFYEVIDALVFPSQWKETFGLTIREALARGLPVIRTDGGGQAEHAPTDLVTAIPIGPDHAPLALAITGLIQRGRRPLTPQAQTLYADQAHALRGLIAGLIPSM